MRSVRTAILAVGAVIALTGCSVSNAGPMPPSETAEPADAAATVSSAAAAGRWVDAGRVPIPDAVDRPEPLAPKAALLGDGRVLVVGDDRCRPEEDGASWAGISAVAVWDPRTSTWTEAASLDTARARFAIAPLRDGRVLVAGGMNNRSGSHSFIPYDSYSSAWAYDGKTGRWSRAGLLGQARTDPVYAVLRDGRVLVAGGYFAWSEAQRTHATDPGGSGASAQLAAFRPATLADIFMPPPDAPLLLTAEIYDPKTNAWTPTGSLSVGRFGGSAATLADGRVLVVGQRDLYQYQAFTITQDGRAPTVTELYDPRTGRFRPTGSLPGPRYGAALVATADGGAILIGGYTKARADSAYEAAEPPLRSVLRFDPKSGKWSEVAGLRVGRLDATAVRLRDGRILVAGGSTIYGPTSSVEIFDPAKGTWSPGPAMPTPRGGGVPVLLKDGSVLVVGGLAEQGHQLGFLGVCPWGAATAVRFIPGS